MSWPHAKLLSPLGLPVFDHPRVPWKRTEVRVDQEWVQGEVASRGDREDLEAGQGTAHADRHAAGVDIELAVEVAGRFPRVTRQRDDAEAVPEPVPGCDEAQVPVLVRGPVE